MGNFGRYVYTGNSFDQEMKPGFTLILELHDSDFVSVDFQPRYSGCGRFYLGFQPRDYFEDPSASEPVDREREAEAFQKWAERAVGRRLATAEILSFIAEGSAGEPQDVFAEDTMERFLAILGLPMPAELS